VRRINSFDDTAWMAGSSPAMTTESGSTQKQRALGVSQLAGLTRDVIPAKERVKQLAFRGAWLLSAWVWRGFGPANEGGLRRELNEVRRYERRRSLCGR
jgi:hypothetical protein